MTNQTQKYSLSKIKRDSTIVAHSYQTHNCAKVLENIANYTKHNQEPFQNTSQNTAQLNFLSRSFGFGPEKWNSEEAMKMVASSRILSENLNTRFSKLCKGRIWKETYLSLTLSYLTDRLGLNSYYSCIYYSYIVFNIYL